MRKIIRIWADYDQDLIKKVEQYINATPSAKIVGFTFEKNDYNEFIYKCFIEYSEEDNNQQQRNFCSRCGKKIPETGDYNYCVYCGHEVGM